MKIYVFNIYSKLFVFYTFDFLHKTYNVMSVNFD